MGLILTAHKMRIYPNDEQINIIETTFGAARRMFNSLHCHSTTNILVLSKANEREE